MKVTVAARDRQHVAARIDVRRQRQRAVLRAASQVQSEAAELAHRRESSLERCAAPTPIDQPLGRSFVRSFTLEQSRIVHVPAWRHRALRAPRSALSVFSSSVLRLAVQRPSRCTWQSHSPCVHDAHARGQQPHTQHPHLASGVYARASTRGLACARRSLVPAPGAQGRRGRQSMQQLEARARRARTTYRWRARSRASIRDGARATAASNSEHQRGVLDRRRREAVDHQLGVEAPELMLPSSRLLGLRRRRRDRYTGVASGRDVWRRSAGIGCVSRGSHGGCGARWCRGATDVRGRRRLRQRTACRHSRDARRRLCGRWRWYATRRPLHGVCTTTSSERLRPGRRLARTIAAAAAARQPSE